MAASRVGETFHLQQTDLVETASKDVDDVAILRCSFGERLVELCRSVHGILLKGLTCLERLLVVAAFIARPALSLQLLLGMIHVDDGFTCMLK